MEAGLELEGSEGAVEEADLGGEEEEDLSWEGSNGQSGFEFHWWADPLQLQRVWLSQIVNYEFYEFSGINYK